MVIVCPPEKTIGGGRIGFALTAPRHERRIIHGAGEVPKANENARNRSERLTPRRAEEP
jgi:hypothetical protein